MIMMSETMRIGPIHRIRLLTVVGILTRLPDLV